jgi:hypothetical protein
MGDSITSEEILKFLSDYGMSSAQVDDERRKLIDLESIDDPFVKKMAAVKNRHTLSIPPKPPKTKLTYQCSG